jgi:hypothetical protein
VSLSGTARDLLRGAIDTHVHVAPDPFAERRMDARQLVAAAAEAGMGGVVLKSHDYPTQPLAWALDHEFSDIGVYGSITLNHAVGGFSPDALDVSLRLGARFVWMPTFDALWSRQHLPVWFSQRQPMTVLEADGTLLNVCHELLDLVHEHDAVLCTGHLSPEETITLVREARRRGIRTVVTHPTEFGVPIDMQRDAANLGAFNEYCGAFIYSSSVGASLGPAMVEEIRAVGPEHSVLSTDLGNVRGPFPVSGFGGWIQYLLDAGFKTGDVRRMACDNPESLLQ